MPHAPGDVDDDPRVQLDLLVERPGADPRRAFLEHADRRDHSPGQENAGQHREPEAQHEDDGAPDDRSPERSVGGSGGTLDEDEPSEGRNRGVGRQHPPAPETLCDHGHRSARPGRFHLGQAGEIPLQPQHPIVRVGDELVPGIHHVGIPVRADLDLGNDLLHGAKADLGRGHLDGVLASRHCQRHVRLRLVLEVDGAPVRLARSRLHELGLLGEVLLASDHIRLQARDTKLLLAGEVEVAQRADRGNITQHSQEVELALLGHGRAQSLAKAQLGWSHLAGVGIVGRGPGRLAHLQLDLFQKLLDAGRRGHRLRALHPEDRVLSLPVDEVELDKARGHQHAADQHEEDDDVLAEEPAARGHVPHRRKASARSRIFRGTVRPRRSAVLRFTARSIFSAPSTGRS